MKPLRQEDAAQQALDKSIEPLSQLILEACPSPNLANVRTTLAAALALR
jgi:hypothetical protein